MDTVISKQPPVPAAKPAGPSIFKRLKSDVPQDRAEAVAELSQDPMAKDRRTAMELIKSVTDRGDRGMPAIRTIMRLTTEPELGIAALEVLGKIWGTDDWVGVLGGRFIAMNAWLMVETDSAAIHAANEAVAMFGLEELVQWRHMCVREIPDMAPVDEAERKLRMIANQSAHAKVALAALSHMRLYEDTWLYDLRELTRCSIHPQVREAAQKKLDELSGPDKGTG
jgi:hypothetical protein